MGQSKGRLEREVHSDTGVPKKDGTFQISILTVHIQELKEKQQR